MDEKDCLGESNSYLQSCCNINTKSLKALLKITMNRIKHLHLNNFGVKCLWNNKKKILQRGSVKNKHVSLFNNFPQMLQITILKQS